MITFLPYSDFNASARVLDQSRLGNQGYREGKCYAGALALYVKAMLAEYTKRGGHTTVDVVIPEGCDLTMPPWLGDERLHSSHRGALLWKNHEYYKQFGWQDAPLLDYYWPLSKRIWPASPQVVYVGRGAQFQPKELILLDRQPPKNLYA